MGHTHTKLLAGAFSVLSVAQFFMVSNLSTQVNQYTENATASIVAAAPMHTRKMQDARLQQRFMHAKRLRSAAGAETTDSKPKTPTGLKLMTLPNGRKLPVLLKRPAQTSTEAAVDATTITVTE